MTSIETKCKIIKDIINYFNITIKDKPVTFGTLEEIEANFFIVDHINLILKYGEVDYVELSWRAFLSYKGGFGTKTASQIIKKKKDPYAEMIILREEYYDWIKMKLLHLHNPEDNSLLDILPKVDDLQANELVTWFTKNPSNKAILLFKDRIKKKYSQYEQIALCISSMGDEEIVSWAVDKLKYIKNNRCLALKILASSPLNTADDIVVDIIREKKASDIICIIQGYGFSRNTNVYKRIEEIIKVKELFPFVQTELLISLNSFLHVNTDIANRLRDKILVVNP